MPSPCVNIIGHPHPDCLWRLCIPGQIAIYWGLWPPFRCNNHRPWFCHRCHRTRHLSSRWYFVPEQIRKAWEVIPFSEWNCCTDSFVSIAVVFIYWVYSKKFVNSILSDEQASSDGDIFQFPKLASPGYLTSNLGSYGDTHRTSANAWSKSVIWIKNCWFSIPFPLLAM